MACIAFLGFPMKQPVRVLVVTHDHMLRRYSGECIKEMEGFARAGFARSIEELERILSAPEYGHDIALLDPFLPFDALDTAIGLLRRHKRPREIIVVSRCAEKSFISTAHRLGVFDYIIAPFSPSRLRTSLLECRERLLFLSSLPPSLTQNHVDALLYQRKQPLAKPFHSARKIPDPQRLLRIMNALAEASSPLSLDEIVRRTKISRSTTWRCLRHLEENGFIGSRRHHEGLGRPSVRFFPLDASRSVKLHFTENNETKKM